MAKHPAPGRVKTRLAARLGEATACALYRAFVLDLAERLEGLELPVTWAYWPPEAPFAALLPGACCRPQVGRDLGERLGAAIAAELGTGRGPVLAIGADAPHVPLENVREAASALTAGADLALGPAADGGYYLIGVRAPAPALFADMAWSTAAVLDTTLDRAARLGLRVHLLPASFDVDEPADLERLAALLRAGAVRLPRTAALLAGATGGGPPGGILDSGSAPG